MTIVKKAEDYVVQLFKDKLSSDYSYHNLGHTQRVVKAVELLAEKEKVEEREKEYLLLAAWFHDVGYCESQQKHESRGMRIAEDFLQKEEIPISEIDAVKQLIFATSLQYSPVNDLEKIMKDADTSHLGSADFFTISEQLRQEMKNANQMKMNKETWAEKNLKFLNDHHYYTTFAKNNWEQVKQENIEKTRILLEELTQERAKKEESDKEKILLNKKKLEKLESPERGIETMFRVTLNNHTRLSEIADSKANILLSVNAIIISVALSTIIPKLDSPGNAHLVIPTFVLIFFSVASIIMAILATRPKISGGTFTKKEIEDRKINLLFFGNFHSVSLDDYTWAMKEMMKDRDYLYESMIKDLYYLGVVLDRKYRILRNTYTVFTIGIVISVIVFYLAFRQVI